MQRQRQTFLLDELEDAYEAEQDALATKAAAKAALADARDEAKRQERMEIDSRKRARAAAYQAKHPPGHAQCGISWYPAGSGWSHCHRCGQKLIYTTDKDAKPQECGWRPPPKPDL